MSENYRKIKVVNNEPTRGSNDDDPLVIMSLPDILTDLELRFDPQWSRLVLTVNDSKPSEWDPKMMELGEYNETVIIFDREDFKDGCFVMVLNPGNPIYSKYPNAEGMLKDYGVVPDSSTDVLAHGYLEAQAGKKAMYTHKPIPGIDLTNKPKIELDRQMRQAQRTLQLIPRLMDKATLIAEDAEFAHTQPHSIGFNTQGASDKNTKDKWDKFDWKNKF